MSSKPYQPLLLRLLHGLNGLVILLLALTGFWIYNTWDGRFGRLALPQADRLWIDIHGTLGVGFLFILVAFSGYSLTAGRHRLIQAHSLSDLTQVGKPVGWYALHRLTNTGMLGAAIFALVSGKLMDENWLPQGNLTSPLILIHLTAWAAIIAALALHLLMIARVGGIPLLLSIATFSYRPEDSPRSWPQQLKAWWQRWRR